MQSVSEIGQFKQLDNLEFIAKQVVEGFITGLHKSPYHGFSVEFAEHRLYNKGESTKHIDWKLFARTERLFVKRYEEETNLRCQIVLDTSSSMFFPYNTSTPLSKLGFSAYSAAALIYLLRKQRDAVGLTCFANDIELQTPSKVSLTHAQMLYAELDKLLHGTSPKNLGKVPPKKTSKTAKLLHLIAENVHKRSLVIIFSDMLDGSSTDELFAALQHLRYNKHEVVLFHVADHKHESHFEYPNRPTKFVDLETGTELKLSPAEVRGHYTKQVNTYFEELKLRCGQYQIDFVEADINRDFKQVLLPFLLKRSKLF